MRKGGGGWQVSGQVDGKGQSQGSVEGSMHQGEWKREAPSNAQSVISVSGGEGSGASRILEEEKVAHSG